MKDAGPTSAAEIFAPPTPLEGRGWQMLRHLPTAAFVFALLAWGATGALAYQRESWGILGATIAIFPTGFGFGGLVVVADERARVASGEPARIGRALGVATLTGLALSLGFAFFMAAIWPSL